MKHLYDYRQQLSRIKIIDYKFLKMTKNIYLVVVFIFLTFLGYSQDKSFAEAQQTLTDRGEVYFQFQLMPDQPRKQLNKLTRIVSIDNVKDNVVTAYANATEFEHFLNLNINFKVLTPPSMIRQPMMLDTDEIGVSRSNWDYYPTYSAYLDVMDQFAADYPDLCELVNIGTLPSGKQLLFIHINDDLESDQNEPEFMYTSSMHGDELAGFILSLHLIEYLLENYGDNEKVTNLVDNIDIWINPLANPDGTYAGGDNTVFGATRYNANYVDLNRNYPDFQDGPHPDGNSWQPETEAFMAFADEHDFVMSANMHGGEEVCNYPWDTWSKRHPDDDWWIYVCRQWADTVHAYGPPGYFTDLNSGITNGYDWYTVNGGRQDYMNYYHHCREFTLELTHAHTPPASQLPQFWESQYRSFLNYMEQALYGVRGKVTNADNGSAIEAEVFVNGHDEDESQVYSSLPVGNYHRPIKEGTYNIKFSAPGFFSKTVSGVAPQDLETTILNVSLFPFVSLSANFSASDTLVETGATIDFTDTSSGNDIVSWDWSFEGGEPSSSSEENPSGIVYNDPGMYNVSLTVTDNGGGTSTLTRVDFIQVTNAFTIKDTTIYLCDGLFYDTGGKDANYSDNEDHTITFISLLESGTLEVVFQEFETEVGENCDYDYLEAFDGSDVNAPFIGKWCGNEIPNSITAQNIEGALTFRFHSNESLNFSGWKAFVTCDTSVGTAEHKKENLNIFPNPSNDFVTFQATENIRSLRLFDVHGVEVYQTESASKQVTVNVKALSKGIYIAVIETGKGNFTKKILVQ